MFVDSKAPRIIADDHYDDHESMITSTNSLRDFPTIKHPQLFGAKAIL